MRIRNAPSITIAVLAVLAALPVWLDWQGPARIGAGLALTLLLPGAAALALTAAGVRPLPALGFTIALSTTALVLVGLALGAAHLGFASRTWATTLAVLSIALGAASNLVQREQRKPRIWATPDLRQVPDIAAYLVAVVVVIVAVGLAHHNAVKHLATSKLVLVSLPLSGTHGISGKLLPGGHGVHVVRVTLPASPRHSAAATRAHRSHRRSGRAARHERSRRRG